MTNAGDGLEERTYCEVYDMKKETWNEGEIKGSANVLFTWLPIFLNKFMDARFPLLERKLDVISDKNDIRDHLYNEVNLEPH